MNKKIMLYMVIVLTVIGTSCSKEPEVVVEEETASTYVEVSEVKVDIVEDKLLAIGKIEAKSNIKISANNQGAIEKIYIKTGDKVSKGQKLFMFDNEVVKNSFNATESQLRTVRDNLKIRYTDLENSFGDTEKLYSVGAVSESEYNNAKSSLDQLKRQYDDSVVTYNNQVNNLRENIKNMTITSPIVGKIGAIYIKEGEVSSGGYALEIIDDTAMVVKFDVTAKQLGNIELGDITKVFPDGEKENELLGEIVEINEIPNNTTGLFEVTSTIDYDNEKQDRKNKLFSGEYAEIIVTTDVRDAVVIPKDSVRTIGEESVVFVIGNNNEAVTKNVELGIMSNEKYEVISGLNAGDVIITTGQTYLSPGDTVVISE